MNSHSVLKKALYFKKMVSKKDVPCMCPAYKLNGQIVGHFHCQLCELTSSYWNCILRHEARSHEYTRPGVNRFECVVCNRIFVYVYDYVKHLQKHLNEDANNERVIAEISQYEHFVGMFSKNNALKKVTPNQALMTHKKTSKNFKKCKQRKGQVYYCTKCNFFTRYKHSIIRHKNMVHNGKEGKQEQIIYECAPCHIKTRYKWDYLKHLDTKRHKNMIASIETSDKSDKVANSFENAIDINISTKEAMRVNDRTLSHSATVVNTCNDKASFRRLPFCKLKMKRKNNEWKCSTGDMIEEDTDSQEFLDANNVNEENSLLASGTSRQFFKSIHPIKMKFQNYHKFYSPTKNCINSIKKHVDNSYSMPSCKSLSKAAIKIIDGKLPVINVERLIFKGRNVLFCCGNQPKVLMYYDYVSEVTNKVKKKSSKHTFGQYLPSVTAKKFKSAMMYHHMVRNLKDRSKASQKNNLSRNFNMQPRDEISVVSEESENFEPVILAAYSVDPALWSNEDSLAGNKVKSKQPKDFCSASVEFNNQSVLDGKKRTGHTDDGIAKKLSSSQSQLQGVAEPLKCNQNIVSGNSIRKLIVHITSVPFDAEPTVITLGPSTVKYSSLEFVSNNKASVAKFSSSSTLECFKIRTRQPARTCVTIKVNITSVPFVEDRCEFIIPLSSRSGLVDNLYELASDNYLFPSDCQPVPTTNCAENQFSPMGQLVCLDQFAPSSQLAVSGSCLLDSSEMIGNDSFKQPRRLRRKQERPQRSDTFITNVFEESECSGDNDILLHQNFILTSENNLPFERKTVHYEKVLVQESQYSDIDTLLSTGNAIDDDPILTSVWENEETNPIDLASWNEPHSLS